MSALRQTRASGRNAQQQWGIVYAGDCVYHTPDPEAGILGATGLAAGNPRAVKQFEV